MNWTALGLGGIVVLLLLPGSKKLEKGKTYVATFQAPENLTMSDDLVQKVKSILPAGADALVNGDGRLVVTFIAVNDKEITDFVTPVGTFKLISVRPA